MTWDNSRLDTFKACPRRFQLRYELGLFPVDNVKEMHSVMFGSAVHVGFQILYKGGSVKEAVAAFHSTYPYLLDEEDKAKTPANGEAALRAYAEAKLADDLKQFKVLSVEDRVTFPFAGQDAFTVKLDMVVEHREHGGIYGWDNKTTGKGGAYLGLDFWSRFEPDAQVTKYCAYVTSKYGDCAGFFINAVGFGYRSRMYKGEPAGAWFRFGREMFNRNRDQIEQEAKDTAYWIERVEDARRRGMWAQNTQSCWNCTYRPVCAAGWTPEKDMELITCQFEKRDANAYLKEVV